MLKTYGQLEGEKTENKSNKEEISEMVKSAALGLTRQQLLDYSILLSCEVASKWEHDQGRNCKDRRGSHKVLDIFEKLESSFSDSDQSFSFKVRHCKFNEVKWYFFA